MAGYEMGVRQRANMGEGKGIMGSSEDFGCKQAGHTRGPMMAPIAEGMKGDVGDGEKRGAPPPVKHTRGQHPSQAEVDHGKHGMPAKVSDKVPYGEM